MRLLHRHQVSANARLRLGAVGVIIVAVDLGHMAFGASKKPARRTRR